MARKKKPTRKYKPRNFFGINHDKKSMHHPNYIFGEKNGKYYSFGLTHSPKEEYPYVPLEHNPNPNDLKPSYVQKKPLKTSKRLMEPLSGWRFHPDDWSLIRHMIKKHKKSQNKKKGRQVYASHGRGGE